MLHNYWFKDETDEFQSGLTDLLGQFFTWTGKVTSEKPY